MADVKESNEPSRNAIMETVVEIGILTAIALPFLAYLAK